MSAIGVNNGRLADWTWDEMIAEFLALGGTLINVEQRHGTYGFGLFPINPSDPVVIHVPENLLVPTKWLQVVDGDLAVAEESGLDQSVREYFARYQRNFSWGRDGRRDAVAWWERVNSLPEKTRQVVGEKLGIAVPEVPDDEYALGRYVGSRCIGYRGDWVIMPIIELINHSPNARGYDVSSGIRVSGVFHNEIYVTYGPSDPLHRYANYGFVCAENTAYSLQGRCRNLAMTVTVNRNVNKAQGKNSIEMLLPVIEQSADGTTLSFLMLGSVFRPRVPRSVFRRIFPHLSHDQADELFQVIVGDNIKVLVDLLRVLDDDGSQMAHELREVIRLQLIVLAHSFGVRDLDTLQA